MKKNKESFEEILQRVQKLNKIFIKEIEELQQQNKEQKPSCQPALAN